MKDLNTTYETPMVEIIEVEVEQGFATSNSGSIEDSDITPGSKSMW